MNPNKTMFALALAVCSMSSASGKQINSLNVETHSETDLKPRIPLTLSACVELTLEHHPLLKAQQHAVEASKDRAMADLTPYVPQLSLLANTGQMKGAISNANPTGEERFHQLQATVRQLVYAFGRRSSQLKLSRQATELEDLELNSLTRDLSYEAQVRYANALAAMIRLETMKGDLVLAEAEWETSKSKMEAGTISKTEGRRAEIQVLNAKRGMMVAKLDWEESIGFIERLTGQSQLEIEGSLGKRSSPLSIWGDDPPIKSGVQIDSLKLQLDMADALLINLKSTGAPSLSLFGQADRSGYEWDDKIEDWRAGVELQWSVQNTWGQWKLSEAQAKLKSELEEFKRDLILERKREWEHYQRREKSLMEQKKLALFSVEASDKNYKSTIAAFDAGATTYPLVEESRQAWTESKLQLALIEQQWDLHVAELERWMF